MRSKLESFKKFVGMLRSHLDGVLAWTDTRLSNGAVEGMNNKIKSISHRSFGFRSAANSSRPSITAAPVYRCRSKANYTFRIGTVKKTSGTSRKTMIPTYGF